jgi:threonine dehydrogenase-like Zn-dependent dehydrogenase
VRALVCGDPPRLVTDHPEPAPGRGELLVRTRVAGICDTDLQLARGYMGFRGVLGHEFVGEVLSADGDWRGK